VIWLIIGLAPFAGAALWALIVMPRAFSVMLLIVAAAIGSLLLATYGGWEMGWFEHCGDFWQSATC
jgi:hypothetical protein